MRVLPERLKTYIASRDYRLMKRVHRWDAPKWIRLWMIWATRGGDGWLWYAIGAGLLLFGGPNRYESAGAAGLSAGTGIALFFSLKRVAGRERPCALEPHCWATLRPPDPFSFPSGHSLTAFAIATSVGLFHPHLLAGLLFCAVSVAMSRVLLGMHYLSDVIAGSAIGSSLGYLAFLVMR